MQITKEQWKEICKRIGVWCNFDEVKDLTYEEAEHYIATIPVWVPM